jgi:hypothetical protein
MKIVHIFFTLMAGIPATLLGSSLISIFPHMPKPIYYILVLGIPIGGGYFIWKRLHQNYIDMDAAEDMPSYLHEQTMFYLVIGSIIGSLLQVGSDRTAFYLDNGTSREITFNIVKEGAFKVPAKQHLHVSVVMGENVIEYEGKTKK